MVTKPEHWRVITPLLGIANFLGICIVGIVSYFMIRTVDQFDKHLDKIDTKFESQTAVNERLDHRLTLIQGQCCKKSKQDNDDLNTY